LELVQDEVKYPFIDKELDKVSKEIIDELKLQDFNTHKVEMHQFFLLKNDCFICNHIAKATRANAATRALSKSLQSQRTERNCFKKLPTLKK